jgi:hypothetical protein
MKPNENREEEIIPKEGEEELDNSAEGEEEEENSPEEEEENEEGEEEEEEGSDEGEEGEDGEFTMPDKFKGKSAEEIAKAYANLERKVDATALKKAQDLLQKGGGLRKKDGSKPTKKELDDFEEELKKVDFTKMKPDEFARWMNQRIMVQATRIAQGIFERSTALKQSVSKEITEATKVHPHLKDNESYREIVISMIEAAAGRGETLTLKEACKKADKAMNIKPGDKPKPKEEGEEEEEGDEEKPKKKPKTGVEKPEGGAGDKEKTDEEKVKEGLLSGGSSSGLGGLGV